jgi:hypothetical protein
MRKEGTYAFSYACVDGVSVDIRKNEREITPVACETAVELGDATSVEVLVTSEKTRFVDLAYTITFTENGANTQKLASRSTVTIVNATIPTSGAVANNDVKEETPAKPAPVATTPKPVKTPVYTAGTPTTVTKYIYTTPVSDPKGKIDLQVTFLGVGTLSGKTFIPKTSIDIDDQSALQFEVKNIGTKTAEDWSYEANLPSDISYASDDQKALKPNERAVITLGFEGISKTGTEEVSVEVTAKNDVKTSNDEFEKTIKIVD